MVGKEEKTKENSDAHPFVAEEAVRLKTMNITDRLTNSTVIISTLCRRMLTNAERGEKRSGNESREVEEGEEKKK